MESKMAHLENLHVGFRPTPAGELEIPPSRALGKTTPGFSLEQKALLDRRQGPRIRLAWVMLKDIWGPAR
jgi:hypothetical protein